MYPAARFAVFCMWILAILLLVGAVISALAAFGVIQSSAITLPKIEGVDFQRQGQAEQAAAPLFFGMAALANIITAIWLFILADLIRAVLNTAVNTREMVTLMRSGVKYPTR